MHWPPWPAPFRHKRGHPFPSMEYRFPSKRIRLVPALPLMQLHGRPPFAGQDGRDTERDQAPPTSGNPLPDPRRALRQYSRKSRAVHLSGARSTRSIVSSTRRTHWPRKSLHDIDPVTPTSIRHSARLFRERGAVDTPRRIRVRRPILLGSAIVQGKTEASQRLQPHSPETLTA